MRVTDLALVPDPRSGEVELAVHWENTSARTATVEMRFDVQPWKKPVSAASSAHTVATPPGRGTLRARLRVPGPSLWDLEQPNLYRLQVEVLADGQGTDLVERRFGFREFTARDGRWRLVRVAVIPYGGAQE